MTAKTKLVHQVNIRIDGSLLARLEKERSRIAKENPGMSVTIGDAMRVLVHAALESRQ